jgi:hypothetical protein
MSEIPVPDPLLEAGILYMPARPSDFERRPAGHLARRRTHHGKAPSRRLRIGLGDAGSDHPNLALIAIERIDLVDVPELHMLFGVGIVGLLAGFLAVPEAERFSQRLVLFFLQDDEPSLAAVVQLSHYGPIGVEGVQHEGIDETSVGLGNLGRPTPMACPAEIGGGSHSVLPLSSGESGAESA